MRTLRVNVDGFRALRAPLKIELKNGASLCLLAENGRGKSSIVDALEFWGTGDVGWVHRDGVGLGALVHLDAEQATVEVRTDAGVASRTLVGSSAGALTAGQGPMAVGFEPEPMPILRNRTMAAFVTRPRTTSARSSSPCSGSRSSCRSGSACGPRRSRAS